jgi:hypothetical protein
MPFNFPNNSAGGASQPISYLRMRLNPIISVNFTTNVSINGYANERLLWSEATAQAGDKITYNTANGGFTVKAGTAVTIRCNVNKGYSGGVYTMSIADVTSGTATILTSSSSSNLGLGGDGVVSGHRRDSMSVVIQPQLSDRIYVIEHIGGWNSGSSYWNTTVFSNLSQSAITDWTNIEIIQLPNNV